MKHTNVHDLVNDENIGDEAYALAGKLYPICRSITGNGVRTTLEIIGSHIPIETYEIPTGTQVFDWTIPREWNISDAYIKNDRGERIVDFRKCNLHVLNYSIPVNKRVSLDELKHHLYSLPDRPGWIPYRTSYYKEDWGFCITHNQLMSLPEGDYEVCIDSSLEDGHLTYGECILKGESEDEVLISTHICHPSLANDNLSGISLITLLASNLARINHRYTYRFLFIPGTIGSITWLSRNENTVGHIRHGLVISCVGDNGGPTYKRSRDGNNEIDQVMQYVLQSASENTNIIDFSPYGYDERQFCSPAFNLPVGLFERSQYGQFPEYHTSADNLDFIQPEYLAESYQLIVDVLDTLENNRRYINNNPKCEPQLGKRGLYETIGGDNERERKQMAMLWILNQSDGKKTLLDIAIQSNLSFRIVKDTAQLLELSGLLSVVG